MPPTIPVIISQHTEEAALCWLRRDRGVSQPHFSLSDVVNVDSQLAAHLDGLRVAGDDGWASSVAELQWQEPAEYFVAAVLAFASGDPQRCELVLSGAVKHEPLLRASASALGWLSPDRARPLITQFVTDSDAPRRCLAASAAAIHRFDLGEHLQQALTDDDDRLRARSLRAVGELGRIDLMADVREQLHSHDLACRAAAALTLARCAGPESRLEPAVEATLRDAVEKSARDAGHCLQMLMVRTEPQRAGELVKTWFENPSSRRDAVTGAGLLGDPALVPWLLERCDPPQLARLAGEAFTRITGLAIDQRPYEAEWPAGFEAGPNDDPDDENVALDPDENLPWPNQSEIADWWLGNRGRFTPGRRYLLGQPLDKEDWLLHVLRHGYQRQRASAALELAARQPTTPWFNVRAPGFRQLRIVR